LSITCPHKIKYFSFFPGVIVEENHMSVQTPFFAGNRSIFHGGQFQNLWVLWLFSAEEVKNDSGNLMGRPLLFIEIIFNVKGLISQGTMIKFL
jgi:hypothetical protein